MLELRNIVKEYLTGESKVTALRDVSLKFRNNEFVAILGSSGCGKTTMLNIVGGLDRYTSGDLLINGISTKKYKDSDWDSYRNHSIGFVFQSYNLIPHQTVLSNVELALTLSGVSKAERRARAKEALKQVGLEDQIHKKPNQMSGGQMQRVAIARALVNNPDILLADEPTGALDTQTSVQIMELLKEVAKDRLVIMVTHNPELADKYATRIVRLRDGEVISDSNPVAEELAAPVKEVNERKKNKKKNKTSMSFFTALSLSLNNLMTKKTRTALTSFAGSIGIIGIALILALSNGIQVYIDQVQEDTLSTYPLTLQAETQDFSALLAAMTDVSELQVNDPDPNKIYVDDSMGSMAQAMSSTIKNDLVSFKSYLEKNYDKIEDSVSDIRYSYSFDLQMFSEDGKTQVNPTTIFDNMGDMFSGVDDMMGSMSSLGGMSGMSILSEMIDNKELLDQQYELVGDRSRWPENANEVVLVVGKNNQISKMTLYMLGVEDQSEIEGVLNDLMMNGTYESKHMETYELDDFLNMKFRLLNTSDFFAKSEDIYTVDGVEYPVWYDMRTVGFDQETFVTENGIELVVSGIVRPRAGATAASISGAIGYTKELTDYILSKNLESEVIKQQKATPDNNVLTGASFERIPYTRENIGELIRRVGTTNMNSFYGVMTSMIVNNPDYKSMLEINDSTVAMFIGTMENDKQAQKIGKLLELAKKNDVTGQIVPQILMSLSYAPDGLKGVTFTEENVVSLLPLMSSTQVMMLIGIPETPATDTTAATPAVMGLKDICSPEDKAAFFAEMNAEMASWKVGEKSMSLLLSQMDDEMFSEFEETLYSMVPDKDATYDSTLRKLGDAEKSAPATINFYAKDFASKKVIEDFISEYNNGAEESQKVQYTDVVGIMMSSVSTIIDVISYVLIAFVSISLVVSSIMIGIITYISVLERTKEIGILRSIGASKRDISRVFNAETMIIGFGAGFIGVGGTLLLCIPINAIIHAVSGIDNVSAQMPLVAGVVLIIISVVLTLISGLFPARLASKKDPVEALRSE